MKVWVVCQDIPYEGFSAPEYAFDTEEKAKEMVKRLSIRNTWYDYFELDIN